MKKTSHESEQFMLRLPDGMRDRIKVTAERNSRTMNAEMVDTLEKAYPREIIEQNLHSRTIAQLQNCHKPADIQKILAEANAMAARNGFPFSYGLELNDRSEKEKTILITIKTI